METKETNAAYEIAVKSTSELLHSAIHDLHAQSEFLLDNDKMNDSECLMKLDQLIKNVGRFYQTRALLG